MAIIETRDAPWCTTTFDIPHHDFEESVTEQVGYRTSEQIIRGLIDAGEKLENFRRGIFDENLDTEDYAGRDIYPDDFDMLDKANELNAKQKARAEEKEQSANSEYAEFLAYKASKTASDDSETKSDKESLTLGD